MNTFQAGRPPVIAVLGKGGAGKTVVSALIARALLDQGRRPVLLVDADPTGGLAWATGVGMERSLGEVREALIRDAGEPGISSEELGARVDWMALEALVERPHWSLLAMGRTDSRGCFCPVNTILRQALGVLMSSYAAVVLDAEAGLEQVSRQIVQGVDVALVVTDGSLRGLQAAQQIAVLLERDRDGVPCQGGLILNRASELAGDPPGRLPLLCQLPEDVEIRSRDAQGRSLLELSSKNPVLDALRAALPRIGL